MIFTCFICNLKVSLFRAFCRAQLCAVTLISVSADAQTIARYRCFQAKAWKQITLSELSQAYDALRQSVFQPPSPKAFLRQYLRFKAGVQAAYHEKSLVKGPNNSAWITSPSLKAAFERELYKAYADLKLKKQISALDKKSDKLSQKALRKLYNKNPEYSFNFISVNYPLNPSPAQIKSAKARADKIYKQVRSSKKPFGELTALYSDDKILGGLNAPRSRRTIPPRIYSLLKKTKRGVINSPVQVSDGFQIVRLRRRIPFEEADQAIVRTDYYSKRRTWIFNTYFSRLLKEKCKVKIINENWLKKT